MKAKPKVPTYNDGFVSIYRRLNMTANKNITSLDELEFIITLAYSEMSRRQQDMDFAEQNAFSLSSKIKTQRPMVDKKIDTYCFAVISGVLYGIGYIDTNSTELFFYLEKVREVG